MKRQLIIFGKAPLSGQVKSRLAKQVGADAAAGVHARLLFATAGCLSRLTHSGITVELSVATAQGRAYFSEAFPELSVTEQSEGDLGERMRTAFERAFDAGADEVALVGSDIPDMSQDVVMRAFNALERVDLVLAPANDGGYVLIGMRDRTRAVFDGIEWGRSSVLKKTIAQVDRLGISCELLEPLGDVDTVSDLRAWQSAVRDGKWLDLAQ
ncbi:TIGR04282 family arsenosugar biosynthesis glycosyltransferase [Candidatus Bipolaricaulota bacterium]